MVDLKPWISRAERLRDSDGYTYADLARDLVDTLGWTATVDVAAALRAHVYSWPGDHALHSEVRPLFQVLGWEQAALLASWFRDARNWPEPKRTGRRLPGGWPAAAKPHTDH